MFGYVFLIFTGLLLFTQHGRSILFWMIAIGVIVFIASNGGGWDQHASVLYNLAHGLNGAMK